MTGGAPAMTGTGARRSDALFRKRRPPPILEQREGAAGGVDRFALPRSRVERPVEQRQQRLPRTRTAAEEPRGKMVGNRPFQHRPAKARSFQNVKRAQHFGARRDIQPADRCGDGQAQVGQIPHQQRTAHPRRPIVQQHRDTGPIERPFGGQMSRGLGPQKIAIGRAIAQNRRRIDGIDAPVTVSGCGAQRGARRIPGHHPCAAIRRASASWADTLATLAGLRTTGTDRRCRGIITLSP